MHFFILLFLALKLIRVQTSPSPSSNTPNFGVAQVLQDPFPYDFPNMDAAPMALFPMPSCHGITLEEATIDQLQDAMSHGKLTSVQILNCYLARVSQTNSYCKYDLAYLLTVLL
jgi:amidase